MDLSNVLNVQMKIENYLIVVYVNQDSSIIIDPYVTVSLYIKHRIYIY